MNRLSCSQCAVAVAILFLACPLAAAEPDRTPAEWLSFGVAVFLR